LRLLIVEDEPFIALDLEMLLEQTGHQAVGVADTFESAVALADRTSPEAALIDVNLRDGFTGVRIAETLARRGRAVAFVTGNAEQVPPDFAGAVAVLEKPFTAAGVDEVLQILAEALGQGRAAEPRYARRAPVAR